MRRFQTQRRSRARTERGRPNYSAWPTRIGAVKPGYFADLLVVRGDPVSSITATRSVALVIKSGRVVFAEDPSLPPAGL